jgi:hypothetical protein
VKPEEIAAILIVTGVAYIVIFRDTREKTSVTGIKVLGLSDIVF